MNSNFEKLGNVVEFLDHKRKPVKASERKAGGYPYYGANGQQGTINDFIFDEPLILVAEDGGHFGIKDRPIAYRVNGKCWVNNHAHVLRPKKNVDIEYLFRQLQFLDVIPFITGTTRGKLTKNAAARIPIVLPPPPEQRRIASILDKADSLRRKRAETLKLLDQFLRSVFLDMFGDPVNNPKKWKKKKLKDVGTLDRGKSKHRPRNAPELLGGPYPLIQTGDVANSGGYITGHYQTYSELGLKQSRMWPAGTLCITIAANIAKTGILTFDACFPDSVVGFTPDKIVRTEYVQFWLSFLQEQLEETAPESAQKNINLKILRDLDIPLPPENLQEKFISAVLKTKNVKQAIKNEGGQLENLFNSLTQRAFRREL